MKTDIMMWNFRMNAGYIYMVGFNIISWYLSGYISWNSDNAIK